MASALAKVIRATSTNPVADDKVDLANFSELQARDLCQLAFSDPIEASEPLCFVFVIGGGKLVRTKYNEDMGKWLSSSLRELGYEDDRSAALGSQGAFKQQQDLGQNLVYLKVFPKIVKPAVAVAAASAGAPARPAALSPAQRVLTCDAEEFQRIVPGHVLTWGEKRVALGVLAAGTARISELEGKMATRVALSEGEAAEYETLNREVISEKSEWLHKEVKAQVSAGLLTAPEFAVILTEMDAKLRSMRETLAKLPEGHKSAAAATAALSALTERREAMGKAAAKPASLPPLRGDADIRKTKAALASIKRLEDSLVGKLGSLAQAREIAARTELEAHLAELLEEARGWFETEEAFDARVKLAASIRGPRR